MGNINVEIFALDPTIQGNMAIAKKHTCKINTKDTIACHHSQLVNIAEVVEQVRNAPIAPLS